MGQTSRQIGGSAGARRRITSNDYCDNDYEYDDNHNYNQNYDYYAST